MEWNQFVLGTQDVRVDRTGWTCNYNGDRYTNDYYITFTISQDSDTPPPPGFQIPIIWKWEGVGGTTRGGDTLKLTGEGFIQNSYCTSNPTVTFIYSSTLSIDCPLDLTKTLSSTELSCTVPSGQGNPEIRVTVCDVHSHHLPRWPTDMWFWVWNGRYTNDHNEEYCVDLDNRDDVSSHTWGDNWFCSKTTKSKVQWVWSDTGDLSLTDSSLRCIHIYEPQEVGVWDHTYLCWPSIAPYDPVWSYSGPIDDLACQPLREGSDPYWSDGTHYLCTEQGVPYGEDEILRYNYGVPLINPGGISPSEGPTYGGVPIAFSGDNFGSDASAISVTIGDEPCTVDSGSLTHQYFECSLPIGEGTGLDVVITVSNKVTTLLGAFSYSRPTVSSITPNEGPSQGSTSVIVRGRNFGLSSAGVSVRIGTKVCTNPVLTVGDVNTEDEVSCTTPSGLGRDQTVFVITSLRQNTVPEYFHYTRPQIFEIDPETYVTDGLVTMKLTGTSFGSTGKVTVGANTCSPVGTGHSHQYIECQLPPGQGANLTVMVQQGVVNPQLASVTKLFSYDAPNITSIEPLGGVSGAGVFLTVNGHSFGTGSDFGVVTVGGQPCDFAFGTYAHSRLICAVPVGGGHQVEVKVVVEGQESNIKRFNYAPVISQVTINGNGYTSGGDTVVITGSGFATPAYPATVLVGPVGSTQSCNVLTQIDTQIECELPPGQGRNLRVVVTVDGQTSLPSSLSYAAPILSEINPKTGDTVGLYTLSVDGFSFGLSPKVVWDGSLTACTAPTGVHSQVNCTVPAGTGANIPVAVRTADGRTSNSVFFSYNKPSILDIEPTTGPTAGNIQAVLTGSNFGPSGARISMSSNVILPSFQNDSYLVFTIPPGQGRVDVTVTSDLLTSDNSASFQYAGPNVTDVTPLSGPTSGLFTIVINGANFGSVGTVSVGGKSCSTAGTTIGYTDSKIECTVQAGVGTGLPVIVTSSGKSSEEEWLFNYNKPVIDRVSPEVIRTAGQDLLFIEGSNFGTLQDGGVVSVNDKACVQSGSLTSYSHTQIYCRSPSGSGTNRNVAVTVGEQTSDASENTTVSYGDPVVTTISPKSGLSSGQTKLVITGDNFGTSASVSFIDVDGLGTNADCPLIGLGQSHTRIECQIPEGQGTSKDVIVSVGSQSSVAHSNSRYSYTAPHITAVTAVPSLPTDGSFSIVLTGTSFGLGHTYVLEFDSVSRVATSFSHTSITFDGIAGTGTGKLISLSVASQPATVKSGVSLSLNYDLPTITGASGCPGDELGVAKDCSISSTRIVIEGSNFGTDNTLVAVRIGYPLPNSGDTSSFQSCSNYEVNQTHISCDVGQWDDGGTDLKVEVEVDGQITRSSSGLISFSGPELYAGVFNDPSIGVLTLSSPIATVTLEGRNFGTDESAVSIKYGPPGNLLYDCEVVPASLSEDIDTKESSIQCTVDEGGVGAGLVFQLQSGTLISNVGTDILNYPTPNIIDNSIRGEDGLVKTCCYTGDFSQGDLIKFDVENVGDRKELITVKYGLFEGEKNLICSDVQLTKETAGEPDLVTLQCLTAAGSGSNYRFVIEANGAVSDESQVQYNYQTPPSITDIYAVSGCDNDGDGSVSNCPTVGGDRISISGADFGESNLVILVGGSECVDTEYVNTTYIGCELPVGVGEDVPIVVKVGPRFSSSDPLISYAEVEVTQIEGCASNDADGVYGCARAGGDELVFTGHFFGAEEPLILVNGRECVYVSHSDISVSDGSSSLTCTLGQGTSLDTEIIFIQNGGQITTLPQTISYRQCPAGQYAESGVVACTDCPAGTYTDAEGQRECVACEPGTVTTVDGESSCVPCGLGFYANKDSGADACLGCPPGYYGPEDNLYGSCIECPEGTYSTESNSTECVKCAAGTANDEPARDSTCEPCGDGEYTPFEGTVTCAICEAGTRSEFTSNSQRCVSCDKGFFSTGGTSSCSPCDEGTYLDVKGGSSCLACDSGYYANLSQSIECEPCERGYTSTKSPTSRVGPKECDACPGGSITYSKGQAKCELCPRGRYQPDEGQEECLRCPAGSATLSPGLTVCSNCTLGTYAPSDDSPSCELCPRGRYNNEPTDATISCTRCEPGRFQPSAGQQDCEDCDAGKFTATFGQTICRACPSGKYQGSDGKDRCLDCPAGFFSVQISSTEGAHTCEPCEEGKFSSEKGQQDCEVCPAGKYSVGSNNTRCELCPLGTFYPGGTGVSVCQNCTEGRFADVQGSFSCTLCPVGKYYADSGAHECIDCGEGEFQDRKGQDSCKSCLAGTYSSSEGSSFCADCSIGKISNEANDTCTSCPAGRAGTGTVCESCGPGKYQGVAGQRSCELCPRGTYSDGDENEACTQCLRGQYAPEPGSEFCLNCTEGTFASSRGQSECASCPVGEYQDEVGRTECKLCPVGTFADTPKTVECSECDFGSQAPTTGSIVCEECPPGTEGPFKKSQTCKACAAGFWQDGSGKTVCKPCSAGSVTSITGQKQCVQCSPGTVQPLGSKTSCLPCTPGFYQPDYGKLTCVGCEAGRYSDGNSSSTCVECEAGKYSNNTVDIGNEECLSCGPGSYQPTQNKDSCLLCPEGFATASYGQVECSPCDSGEFAEGVGNVNCTQCPAGSFQILTGQGGCEVCGNGTFSAAAGAPECTECTPGRYQNSTNSTDCVDCPAGTYQPDSGQSECLPCQPGTFNRDEKQTACRPCSRGSFAEGFGNEECTKCTNGTYQPSGRADKCLLCEPGTYQTADGQAQCIECAAGSFSNRNGSTECEPCLAGTVQPLRGETECLPCEEGTFALGTRQTKCKLCPAGTFSNDTTTDECTPCLRGTQQPLSGQKSCELCPMGRYGSKDGQDLCTACQAGKFSTEEGRIGSCEDCPIGTFTNSPGQTTCVRCAVGTFASSDGRSSCRACGAGKYTPGTGSIGCTNCDAGKYMDEAGYPLTDCKLCPNGTASSATGASFCNLCASGKESRSEGLTACKDCEPGTRRINEDVCVDCKAGKFASFPGTKLCSSCAPGRYSIDGQSKCEECPAGTSNPLPGGTLSDCKPCLVGEFAPSGSSSCQLCTAGKYANQTGTETCSACPAGFVQPEGGSEHCNGCNASTYFPTTAEGGVLCIQCEKGSFSNQTSALGNPKCYTCTDIDPNSQIEDLQRPTGCMCNEGYYWPANREEIKCVSCPEGANCANNGTTFETLTALPGFWRANNKSDVFYRCQLRQYCVGGESARTGASACTDNREGPMCGVCADGYYATGGGICAACPDSAGGITWFYFFLVAVVIIVVMWAMLYIIVNSAKHLVQQIIAPEDVKVQIEGVDHFAAEDHEGLTEEQVEELKREAEEKTAEDKQFHVGGALIVANRGKTKKMPWDPDYDSEEEADMAVGGFHGGSAVNLEEDAAFRDPDNPDILTIHGPPLPKDDFTYKLKILVTFIQITSNLATGLEIQWPSKYKEFVLWLDIANFDFIITRASSAECVGGFDYYTKYLIVVLFPPVAMLVILIAYLIPRYFRASWYSDMSATFALRAKINFWRMLLFVLFLIYPSVSATILRLYVCKSFDQDKSYLLADLSVQCHTTRWNNYAYWGALLIPIYPIGIPLFFYVLLRFNYNTLRDLTTKASLGFLYAGYRVETWWFEMADMLHKLFLTSLLAFFPAEAQLPVGMVVAFLYMVELLRTNPYLLADDDKLHILAQTEIVLLLMAGNIFYHSPLDSFDSATDWTLSFTLLSVSFIVFGVCAYYVYKSVRGKIKLWWNRRRHKREEREEEEKEKEREMMNKRSSLKMNDRAHAFFHGTEAEKFQVKSQL